ncbi:MAG: acyl-CoA dehydrogenase, partial [bacterium TMED198]
MVLNFNFSDNHKLISKAARDFAVGELAQDAVLRDQKKIWPESQIKQMAELGFMGMMVSQKWDGGGLDTISYCIAMEEISKVDASASVIMSVNNSLVCYLIERFGSNFQKEKYLKKLATGNMLGAFSLSEPQSGSDASNMRTVAKKIENGYQLKGTKNWVTNGHSSDIVLVFALTSPELGSKGISCFIVEKKFPGFSVGKPEEKLGIRSSDTTELYFDDVV